MNEQTGISDYAAVLGVSLDATQQQIRSAYLQKIREHPPDRSPEQFEKVRDAYGMLSNPHTKARATLLHAEPNASFMSLLAGIGREKRFVGPDPWIHAMKEEQS